MAKIYLFLGIFRLKLKRSNEGLKLNMYSPVQCMFFDMSRIERGTCTGRRCLHFTPEVCFHHPEVAERFVRCRRLFLAWLPHGRFRRIRFSGPGDDVVAFLPSVPLGRLKHEHTPV